MNKYLIDPHLVGFLLFLKWRAEENLVVNNKDNRVFMSRNYRSDSCPLEI